MAEFFRSVLGLVRGFNRSFFASVLLRQKRSDYDHVLVLQELKLVTKVTVEYDTFATALVLLPAIFRMRTNPSELLKLCLLNVRA